MIARPPQRPPAGRELIFQLLDGHRQIRLAAERPAAGSQVAKVRMMRCLRMAVSASLRALARLLAVEGWSHLKT